MTSHLHLIVSAKEGYGLSAIIRDFKKHTAKQIIKEISEIRESRREWLLWYFERECKRDKRITKYKFWQEGNHAVYLEKSNVNMIQQKVNYIHNNPVAAGFVNEAWEWKLSSAQNYVGQKGLINVEEL